jgi:hypothetical protein
MSDGNVEDRQELHRVTRELSARGVAPLAGETSSNITVRPHTTHPLFDWLVNSARAADSRNADKQRLRTAREAIQLKARPARAITGVHIG